MKQVLFAAGMILLTGPVALAQTPQGTCGWYAITACKPTFDEADAFARQSGSGFVINTSSPSYPNFQAGYFCVVSGPSDRATALSTAGYWRSFGVSGAAYAKNACR